MKQKQLDNLSFAKEIIIAQELDAQELVAFFGEVTAEWADLTKAATDYPPTEPDESAAEMITAAEANRLSHIILDRKHPAMAMGRNLLKALLQSHKYGHDLAIKYYDRRLSDLSKEELAVLFVHIFFDTDVALDDMVDIENERAIPVIS